MRVFMGWGGPNRRQKFVGAALLLSIAGTAFTASGCAKDEGRVPVYPVKGKVSVLGQVPEGALVVLYPTPGATNLEIRPSGKVKQDGSFELTTYEADDGAPVGDYTATIQWNKLVKRGSDTVAGPNAVPPKFGSPDTSPWKIKVGAAPTDLTEFSVTKSAK